VFSFLCSQQRFLGFALRRRACGKALILFGAIDANRSPLFWSQCSTAAAFGKRGFEKSGTDFQKTKACAGSDADFLKIIFKNGSNSNLKLFLIGIAALFQVVLIVVGEYHRKNAVQNIV